MGDYVLAYDEEMGEIAFYPVTAVLVHQDPVIVLLTIDGETIETTPEHPFYTTEGEWVPAGALLPGDEVLKADGRFGVVDQVALAQQPQLMYNLTVAQTHIFFVGDGQWLVHNKCPSLAHKIGMGHAYDKHVIQGREFPESPVVKNSSLWWTTF